MRGGVDQGGDEAIDQLTARDSSPYFSDAGHRGGSHIHLNGQVIMPVLN